MDQGSAFGNMGASHLSDNDIVVAHFDPAVEGTFDVGQAAGKQGDAGRAGMPLETVEPILALAGEDVRREAAGLPLKR